jgi:hypothetical protein
MKKHEKLFFAIILTSSIITFSSIFIGLMTGGIEGNCETKSIASTINLPYRAACEFTKPRFK